MSPNETGGPRLITYAGDILRVLGESEGIAFCELTVPPNFAGPPPHIHHGFDEALYVLSGALTMIKDRGEPEPVPVGGLILASRGVRHTFANPHDEPAKIVGVWSPATAMGFMEEIGVALPASGPPDPERLADIYRRHDSEIVL